MPFVIDYSTQQGQAQSKLCTIADEFLLKIALFVFSNCTLESWTQSSNPNLGYETIVRVPASAALEGLNFLRTCKLIRRKLLSEYLPDATLGVFSTLRQYDNAGAGLYVIVPNLATRMILPVGMSTATLAGIKKLELSASARHILDSRVFPNLEEILLHKRVPLCLENAAESRNNTRLLRKCNEHAAVPSTEILAGIAGDPFAHRPPIADWISELLDFLASNAATARIRVVMVHEAFTKGYAKDGFRGLVLHDLTNDAIVGKVKGAKDQDRWHKIMGEPGSVSNADRLRQIGTHKILPTVLDGKARFNPEGQRAHDGLDLGTDG